MAFDFHHFNPSHLLECRNLGEADGVGKKHDYIAGVLSAHETGEVETLIPIYAHKIRTLLESCRKSSSISNVSNSIAIEIKADRRGFRCQLLFARKRNLRTIYFGHRRRQGHTRGIRDRSPCPGIDRSFTRVHVWPIGINRFSCSARMVRPLHRFFPGRRDFRDDISSSS